MTRPKALNLVKYRKNHGPINSLDELNDIPGFGPKSVESLSHGIVNEDFMDAKLRGNYVPKFIINRLWITPKFSSSQLPESILSCQLDLDGLCWLHMDHEGDVLDWKHETLPFDKITKYDHAVYRQKVNSVVKEMPVSDVYLLEEVATRVSALIGVPAALNRARLDAVLTTMLAHKHSPEGTASDSGSVYKLRPAAVGDELGLMVGGERTSCRQVVVDAVTGQGPLAEQVYVPQDLADCFLNARHLKQEQMAVCLLLPLMFYRLLKRPH